MTAGVYEFGPRHSVMAYGGRSGQIERRWTGHRWMLRNDEHHCAHLQNAWNKYGEDVFEFRVLEIIEDPDERRAAEQAWLDIHHANKTCYNIAITASPAGPMAKETKQKIRVGMIGKQNGLGYTHTEEWKQANSERMMGKQYALGSKRTEEQNRAKSELMMGHPVSDTTKQKIAASKAKPYPAFVHKETGEIIPAGVNLKHMCRERGFDRSCMRAVKDGSRPRHKGWMLLDGAPMVAGDGQ